MLMSEFFRQVRALRARTCSHARAPCSCPRACDRAHQTQDYTRAHSYDKIMTNMSAQLRGDTALRIAQAQLALIWYVIACFIS